MIDYRLHASALGETVISEIWGVLKVCFDPGPSVNFAARVGEKRKPMALTARDGDRVVGFKLGYERTREEFYSWLGGVLPDYRRRGIAAELLKRQHAWCVDTGYPTVTTEVVNRNVAMLKLNLDHGFMIVGTRADDNGLKVLLSKQLADPPG